MDCLKYIFQEIIHIRIYSKSFSEFISDLRTAFSIFSLIFFSLLTFVKMFFLLWSLFHLSSLTSSSLSLRIYPTWFTLPESFRPTSPPPTLCSSSAARGGGATSSALPSLPRLPPQPRATGCHAATRGGASSRASAPPVSSFCKICLCSLVSSEHCYINTFI